MEIDFDFSKWDFPADRIWLHVPTSEMIWKICIFVPLILFGLFGNFMIVYLFIRNRGLRTPVNLIVANKASADFLTLLICPVMFMINDFFQNYLLGVVGCKSEGFLVVLFLVTAVLNLSVMSYDRLTAIVLPSETRLTLKGAKIVLACTWMAGICFALPLAIYRSYKVRVWKNFTETYCKEDPLVLSKYWYVLITIMVWLPLAIMLICYTAIFIKLDRYEKRVLSREHPLTVSYKKKVAKTLFIVVIIFAVLRLPFTVLVVLRDEPYRKEMNSGMQLFWFAAQYLMFLNAAVNPVIYGFTNDNFRRAYVQTRFYCCRKFGSKQQQDAAVRKPKSKKSHDCDYCKFMQFNKKQTQAEQKGQKPMPAAMTNNTEPRTVQEQPTCTLYAADDDVFVNNIDNNYI